MSDTQEVEKAAAVHVCGELPFGNSWGGVSEGGSATCYMCEEGGEDTR